MRNIETSKSDQKRPQKRHTETSEERPQMRLMETSKRDLLTVEIKRDLEKKSRSIHVHSQMMTTKDPEK